MSPPLPELARSVNPLFAMMSVASNSSTFYWPVSYAASESNVSTWCFLINSNSERILPKSANCGTFRGMNGRSYAHLSLPVSVTSNRAVGEPVFSIPRRGTAAAVFSSVVT